MLLTIENYWSPGNAFELHEKQKVSRTFACLLALMLCESEHAIILKSNQMTNVHEKVGLCSFYFPIIRSRSYLFHPLINRMKKKKSGNDQIKSWRCWKRMSLCHGNDWIIWSSKYIFRNNYRSVWAFLLVLYLKKTNKKAAGTAGDLLFDLNSRVILFDA